MRAARFDAVVIGAGFPASTRYTGCDSSGIRTQVLEMAENVGGTWLFNR